MRQAQVAALILAIPAVALAASPAEGDEAMDAAAAAFYRVYGSFHPSSGVPDAGGRARLAPVLSARLGGLLAAAAQANTRLHARMPAAPPLLEGDIFSSHFEGATSWSLAPCRAEPARCVATLTFVPRSQGGKPVTWPVTWKDTLYLVRDGGQWRADDVGYDAALAGGNSGRLSQTLAAAIRMAAF